MYYNSIDRIIKNEPIRIEYCNFKINVVEYNEGGYNNEILIEDLPSIYFNIFNLNFIFQIRYKNEYIHCYKSDIPHPYYDFNGTIIKSCEEFNLYLNKTYPYNKFFDEEGNYINQIEKIKWKFDD